MSHIKVSRARPARQITSDTLKAIKGRFWPKMDVRLSDDCWEWQGSRDKDGYGRIKIGGAFWPAHRLVMALNGSTPAPSDMVCHHCDNPSCCNPMHLYLGDDATNARDRVARGRLPDFRGTGNGRCKLTADQVREIRQSTGSAAEIAPQYGVSRSTVWDIRRGQRWGHIQ